MKKVFSLLITILLFASGCSKPINNIIDPGFQHFKIAFEQNGLTRDIENNTVELDRTPFTIIVYFTGPDSIFINASFESTSWDLLRDGAPADKINGFSGTDITEGLFNKNETLAISSNSPGFWYYSNENEHRFSKVIDRPGVLICRRRISKIINMDSSSEPVDLSQINEQEIYLAIMKMEWNEYYSKRIEKKREYIKVIFK